MTKNIRQNIRKQRHYFANKGPSSQGYGFSSSLVWMWELDYKESWAPKNWCFWTVVLGKTLEIPLDCKEIQPVHPKGDQSWIFIGRTDVEAETPILWLPDAKSWLIWKDPDAGKDWGQEEKGMTEDEMVGWHHQLDGHGFGWTQGVGDGLGGLVCCSSWGCKESDTTEQLNWAKCQSVLTVFTHWWEVAVGWLLIRGRVIMTMNVEIRIFLRCWEKESISRNCADSRNSKVPWKYPLVSILHGANF